MADFFDGFGKRVADVASDLGKKAGDTMEGRIVLIFIPAEDILELTR